MVMIELNLQIFGQILKSGSQDLFAIMVIKNAITNQPQEVQEQELKVEKVHTKEVKSPNNCVKKFLIQSYNIRILIPIILLLCLM
jgi:hypothetical protein